MVLRSKSPARDVGGTARNMPDNHEICKELPRRSLPWFFDYCADLLQYAPMDKIHPREDPEEERARAALHLLARNRGLSDREIAAEFEGMSTQTVQSRRTGVTKINFREIGRFAEILHADRDVFEMDEVGVYRWLADERAAATAERVTYCDFIDKRTHYGDNRSFTNLSLGVAA